MKHLLADNAICVISKKDASVFVKALFTIVQRLPIVPVIILLYIFKRNAGWLDPIIRVHINLFYNMSVNTV